MRPSEDGFCPTLRPTRAAFERPFCHFVREVFAKNPDLPCFKVGHSVQEGGCAALAACHRWQLLLCRASVPLPWPAQQAVQEKLLWRRQAAKL
jgi:alpha-beta hydrolase superfamily lysophospholipase